MKEKKHLSLQVKSILSQQVNSLIDRIQKSMSVAKEKSASK